VRVCGGGGGMFEPRERGKERQSGSTCVRVSVCAHARVRVRVCARVCLGACELVSMVLCYNFLWRGKEKGGYRLYQMAVLQLYHQFEAPIRGIGSLDDFARCQCKFSHKRGSEVDR